MGEEVLLNWGWGPRAQAAGALPTGSECDSKASVLKSGDLGD